MVGGEDEREMLILYLSITIHNIVSKLIIRMIVQHSCRKIVVGYPLQLDALSNSVVLCFPFYFAILEDSHQKSKTISNPFNL